MSKVYQYIFALIIFTVLGVNTVHASVLSDIQGHKNEVAIESLLGSGVISGYNDGTFKPDAPITRAELLKILVEGKTRMLSDEWGNCFNDVTGQWYAKYICYARSFGWISGYEDGSFRPNQTVTKEEAIKMLIRSQGYGVTAAVNVPVYSDIVGYTPFISYIKKAKDLGILEETSNVFGAGQLMTRANVSENIYRIRRIKEMGVVRYPEIYQDILLPDTQTPYVSIATPPSTPNYIPPVVPTTTTFKPVSEVKYYTNSVGNTVQSPAYYNSQPAGASAQCKDGTYSFSQSRQGTCSGHGGVATWY